MVCGKSTPDIARRFRAAVMEAVDALVAMPAAGAPRYIDNTLLAGLRTWPVKGFDEFRVYYLTQPDLVAVIQSFTTSATSAQFWSGRRWKTQACIRRMVA